LHPSSISVSGLRVIEPPKGWLAVNWLEIWQYRELLYFLTWRDIKVRYKQTVLGILWAFIQPFLRLVIFSVVFGRMAHMDSGIYPYPIFLYAALLPWQFFSDALSRSSMSVVGGGSLVSKVYFPRLVIPIASVGACLVDFAVACVILLGLMLYYGLYPTALIVWMLPLTLLTVVVALGAGIFLSALNVAYRDFRQVVPFMLQVWFFASPIVWPITKVPEPWRWVVAMNPITGIAEAYRYAVLGQPFVGWHLGVSVVTTALLFAFGLHVFRRLEKRFADII